MSFGRRRLDKGGCGIWLIVLGVLIVNFYVLSFIFSLGTEFIEFLFICIFWVLMNIMAAVFLYIRSRGRDIVP